MGRFGERARAFGTLVLGGVRWFVVVCVMMGGGDDLGSSLVRRRGGVWAAIGGVWGGEV